jgi:hypothetical protein
LPASWAELDHRQPTVFLSRSSDVPKCALSLMRCALSLMRCALSPSKGI